MSKTRGARNHAYDEKRLDLLRRITAFVLSVPGQTMSMRQTAQACDVTMPTLTHYFGDRTAMCKAVLEQTWRDAAGHLAAASTAEGNLAVCVEQKLRDCADSFVNYGVDKLNVWGLTQGLGQAALGPAYLSYFLEPTLQAAETWLSHYQAAGDIHPGINIRYAAVSLFGPLIVMFMHQNALGGSGLRPANIDDFIRCHAETFTRSLAS